MGIDIKKVGEITINFLQQQHNVHNIKVVGVKNEIWFVEARVHSSSGPSVRKIQVDGKTGKIISVD
jgi:hypothetical protein